jgi:hypothetical protein
MALQTSQRSGRPGVAVALLGHTWRSLVLGAPLSLAFRRACRFLVPVVPACLLLPRAWRALVRVISSGLSVLVAPGSATRAFASELPSRS